MNLYQVIIRRSPTQRLLRHYIVKAESFIGAKNCSIDVGKEDGLIHGKYLSFEVTILMEPESNGCGYCYPIFGTTRVFHGTLPKKG